MTSPDFDLQVRTQVYLSFVEDCRAPSVHEVAQRLGADVDLVRTAFHSIHERHMIFLEPGTDSIRMANPFSAIPTDYRVRAGGRSWWANCAWDTLGIAAALHMDVRIEAVFPGSTERVELEVVNGKVDGKGHVVYFPLPCRAWYDDLVFT